jgi:cell division inhibitor SepF
MPGAMRKLGLYLGLVEDDEDDRRRYPSGNYTEPDVADDEDEDELEPAAPVAPRRWAASAAGARTATVRRPSVAIPSSRGSVAVDTAARVAVTPAVKEAYRITTLHPRTYNEARTIGEHFRQGTPVIMNLTEMDDGDAKRLVDFAAGLIFGLRGSIERVTNKVFLLSPEHVRVTAEDKARIAEGGFFNQS